MDFKIVWTEPALADLEAIVSYIARDNVAAAERVGDDIISHIEVLGAHPFIGTHYPRGSRGEDREILCRNYRIFYRVFEDQKLVEILVIWHGSRDEPQLPPA
jgi:toxin ParE1/3/4